MHLLRLCHLKASNSVVQIISKLIAGCGRTGGQNYLVAPFRSFSCSSTTNCWFCSLQWSYQQLNFYYRQYNYRNDIYQLLLFVEWPPFYYKLRECPIRWCFSFNCDLPVMSGISSLLSSSGIQCVTTCVKLQVALGPSMFNIPPQNFDIVKELPILSVWLNQKLDIHDYQQWVVLFPKITAWNWLFTFWLRNIETYCLVDDPEKILMFVLFTVECLFLTCPSG